MRDIAISRSSVRELVREISILRSLEPLTVWEIAVPRSLEPLTVREIAVPREGTPDSGPGRLLDLREVTVLRNRDTDPAPQPKIGSANPSVVGTQLDHQGQSGAFRHEKRPRRSETLTMHGAGERT